MRFGKLSYGMELLPYRYRLPGNFRRANIADGAPAAERNDGATITATSEEEELPQEKTAPEASHVLVPKLGPAASAKTYAEPSNLFSAIEENEDAENEPEERAGECQVSFRRFCS